MTQTFPSCGRSSVWGGFSHTPVPLALGWGWGALRVPVTLWKEKQGAARMCLRFLGD